MEHKKWNLMNRFTAVSLSILMLFLNVGTGVRVGAEETAVTPQASAKTVSADEIKAFKVGAIFSFVGALGLMALYFPAREVKGAIDYYGMRRDKYNNFVKSFPDSVSDETLKDSTIKQEGLLWDWAACLSYIMSLRKGTEVKQKDIVKKLFGDCAFFEHNRKESLPVNAFYNSGLLQSLDKLADENCMSFARRLVELGLRPSSKEIEESITNFYSDNRQSPFVISDSYFYNGTPFVHFVVVSDISNGYITVKDPAVGLSRRQPLDAFCRGYIHDNGYSKLPSVDMFTFNVKAG